MNFEDFSVQVIARLALTRMFSRRRDIAYMIDPGVHLQLTVCILRVYP
jgi:hypothetical protein